MLTSIYVEATAEYRLSYDPYSEELLETLKGFKEVIDPEAGVLDMMLHIVHSLRAYRSPREMIEGVGYLMYQGKYHGEPHSGISVSDPDPDYHYTVRNFIE